jgi:hypothetical protein
VVAAVVEVEVRVLAVAVEGLAVVVAVWVEVCRREANPDVQ